MSPALRTALRSATGAHRTTNQDSAAAGPGFAFVADGVGGHAAGDVASRVVTAVLLASLAGQDVREVDQDGLRDLLAAANAALAAQADADPALAGLATTFTGLFIGSDVLRVAHIGDSRCYLLHDGEGSRVSRDDSYVQLLVDAGAIDPADAWLHPQRNLLTQALAGAGDDPTHVTMSERPAQEGDRWLLCTDGLTDYLAEAEILELLAAASDPEQAADRLISAALAADAQDNVSVVVCDVVADQDATQGQVVVGAAEPLEAQE